jgi:hypothetical protein
LDDNRSPRTTGGSAAGVASAAPARPLTEFGPAGAFTADRFGVGTPSGRGLPLPRCSYLVRVSAEVRVTTGEADPSAIEDHIGFCT